MDALSRRTGMYVAALSVLASLFVFLTPQADAVSSAGAIAALNAQRAANGIPGDVRNHGRYARGCAKHARYMKLNHVIEHAEFPGNPGFSKEGKRAAVNSVLAFGEPAFTSPGNNPWESAPLHLQALLDPDLTASGYAKAGKYSCMWEDSPNRAIPPALTAYSYPGPEGSIYRGERAFEGPFTPGQFVGIKQGRLAGPNILVFLKGLPLTVLFKVKLGQVTLTQGTTPVEIRTIDKTHPKVGPYARVGSGFIIPTKPLNAGARYTAKVTWLLPDGTTFDQTWSFTATNEIV